MEQEDTQVVDSAETTTNDLEVNDNQNDDSSGESDAAEEKSETKQQSNETPDQRQARLKRQIERDAKKAGVTVEEYLGLKSQKGGEEKEVGGDERYTRLELKTEGITSKKAQDVVLEYIKEAKLIGKDVDIASALKSNVVKEAIAEIEKKTAVPPPSKRTSAGASDSFEYWKAQARKGNWPRGDKAMMDKLKKARIFTS